VRRCNQKKGHKRERDKEVRVKLKEEIGILYEHMK
jgi:hypothetical protein